MSVFSQSFNACRSVAAMQRSQQAERDFERPALAVIESPPLDPAIELSLMQRLALLGLMNSTLARGMARTVSRIEHCQDRPSFPDYRALVEKGWAEKPEGEPYHEITADGRNAGRKLLAHLCREHDIHIMSECVGTGATSFRCSCAQWSSMLYGKPGMHQHRRAMNSFYKHLPVKVRQGG